MKRHVIPISVVAMCLTAPTLYGQSSGPRITGSIDQVFQLRDNANLTGTGWGWDGRTSIGASLTTATPNTSLSVSSGISLSYDQNGDPSISRPALSFSGSHRNKDISLSAGANFSQSPIEFDELQPNLSLLRVTGDQTNYGFSLGASGSIDSTTSVSLDFSTAYTNYDTNSTQLVDNQSYSLAGSVSHQVNRRTSLGASADIGWFVADTVPQTESLSLGLSGNASHQLTSLDSVSGSLGLSWSETTQGGTSSDAFNATFGAGYSRALPDGSIGLSLTQSIAPSGTGNLVVGTTLSGNYSHTVNSNESYGLSAGLSRQEDVGGGNTGTLAWLSPAYSRQLTRDVSMNVGYNLQRDDTGDIAQGLSLTFSRPFDFPLKFN